MPKDFKGQDLWGRNFKNQDLRGADFSGADIRGAKFTGANLAGANFTRARTGVQKRCKNQDLRGADFSEADIRGAKFTGANLAKANFTRARTGVQKRWMALQFCISFALCGLLDFVGILFAVVFTAFLISPNFPQNTGFFPHIEMLLIQAGIYLTLARQGFTAKALTTITTFVALVLAGAVALALALVLAGAGAGTSAVAVAGAGALAGTLAVTFAGALALALALALAVAGTLAGALAFALAFALALAGAGAVAGALASAIARAGADANALANALADAHAHAIAIAFAALLLSLYVAWRSSKEDEKFEPAHSLGVWLGVLGGTSFKSADLSDADFIGATLNNCDFSHALVTRTRFKDAKGLKRARLKGTILDDKAVRDLLVTGQVRQQNNYRGKNLQGANLADAGLCGADFTEADISGAILAGADLIGAHLTKAQALGTDFTGAKLTGAFIESWNIDADTKFKNVNCKYIFQSEKPNAFGVWERLPSSGEFGPGEFTKLFQEVLNTVDLIFRDGINWLALLTAFKDLQVENEGTKLTVQRIENKGDGVVVVRVSVPPDANKEKIHSELTQHYEMNLKLLESKLKEKDEQILIYRQESRALFAVLESLANQPIIINPSAEVAIMGNKITGNDINVLGSGNTIVNRSIVQYAFDRIKNEYNEETAQALKRVEEEINKFGNSEAADNFNAFSEELQKPEPNKSILRALWMGVTRALPAITQLTDVMSKITKLFGG